jgi:signal peptidase I
MEVTIQEGDELIADMRSYRGASPARGSIIILHSPKDASIFLIKRLIAVGGDTIQGSNGKIFLNEKPLNEPYIEHTGDPPDELVNFGPVTVPPHKLFVMGDNRDISLDSRSEEFGLVDESAVMGKPLYILKAGHDRAGEPLQ